MADVIAPGDMRAYQPVRVNGVDVHAGERESVSRWRLIRDAVAGLDLDEPFTALDVGANLGYFSLRLVEEFDCRVDAVDHGTVYRRLVNVVARNITDRVATVDRWVTVETLERWPGRYDLVLAMSVIHHIDAPPDRTLAAFRGLGRHVILELPTEPVACGQPIVQALRVPDDATVVGHVTGHAGMLRPVVHLTGSDGG